MPMPWENPETTQPEEQSDAPRLPSHWGQLRPRFKNRILTGLLFIVPLGVTGGVAVWIYRWCLQFSAPWITHIAEQPDLPQWTRPAVHFAGVVVTLFVIVVILWLVGSLSSTFLMRRMMRMIEGLLEGIPIVRPVYSFTKQVVQLIGRQQESKAQRVVIIEYPKQRSYVLAFATGETRFSDSDELHVTLFVPTTPNPTSGFMLVLPVAEVRETNLSVEQAARIIMSGGIIVPDKIGAVAYGEGGIDSMPPIKMPQHPAETDPTKT